MSGLADATTPSGFSRSAWLIVAEGGWLRAPEIVEQLPQGVEVADPHNLLWYMARRRNLLVRGERTAREYAVAPGCTIPMHVTVGEAVQAITGRRFEGPRG